MPNPSWTNAGGVIDAMGALLPAWHILRQTTVATPADRATIEAWLVRLARQADVHPGDNNVGTARGAADMMLGLMVGDDARYPEGVQTGFIAQLAAMRPDGSFPLETDRGRAALQLQSRNIALLLFAAEIAASQGQNLYGTRVGGKGVDDAIRFLLAASDNNALVDRYAAANRNPAKAYPVFAPMNQADPVRLHRARLGDALHRALPAKRTQRRNPRQDPLRVAGLERHGRRQRQLRNPAVNPRAGPKPPAGASLELPVPHASPKLGRLDRKRADGAADAAD